MSYTLQVRVVSGANLPAADLNGYSDPYVKLFWGGNLAKTTTKKKTLNPYWNETFNLYSNNVREPLKITVFDWDRFSSDDPLGTGTIHMQELQNGIENPVTVNLSPHGELSLRVKPVNLPSSATASTHVTTVSRTNVGLMPGGEMTVDQMLARMRPPTVSPYPSTGSGYPTGGGYPPGPATYAPGGGGYSSYQGGGPPPAYNTTPPPPLSSMIPAYNTPGPMTTAGPASYIPTMGPPTGPPGGGYPTGGGYPSGGGGGYPTGPTGGGPPPYGGGGYPTGGSYPSGGSSYYGGGPPPPAAHGPPLSAYIPSMGGGGGGGGGGPAPVYNAGYHPPGGY